MSKEITLTVDGTPIHFDVDYTAHERLINAMQPTEKVGPTRNFLMRSVKNEDKAVLKPFLDNPMNVMSIGVKVLEAITPDLEVKLGE